MKATLLTANVLLSLLVQAYDWSEGGPGPAYQFGTSAAPLSTGSVSVPASQTADSVTAYVAKDQTVTFAGGALTLSANGFLCAGGLGTMAFSTPIATAGAVTLSDANMMTTGDLYPTDTESKTVLTNASVDDYDVVSGYLKSGYMDTEATPFNVVRTTGALDAQLQYVDGSWLKCVKVHLADQAGNVVVTIVYGRYVETSAYSLGSDFDVIPTGSTTGKARSYAICQGGTGNGCGLKNLSLSRLSSIVGMEIAGPFAPAGAVTVAKGLNVRLADGTPSGSDVFSAPLVLNGLLSAADREQLTFSGALSGQGGKLSLEPWNAEPAAADPVQVGDKDVVANIIGRTASTLVSNLSLLTITNVSDVYIRQYSGSPNAVKAHVCQFMNNGKQVTFQAQYFEAGQKLIKCACVTLTQSGANVQASALTPYVYFSSDAEAKEFLGSDIYLVQSSWKRDDGGYYPTALTLFVDSTVRHEVLLSGANNTQSSGVIEVGAGRRLVLNATECVPASGVVTVLAGGEAEARVGNAAKKEACRIDVRPGGIFRQTASDAFDNWGPTFCVDGGELALKRGNMTAAIPDCGAYLNLVELAGGARVTGMRTRIGSNSTTRHPVWTVRGGTSSEPVRVTSGFNFVSQGTKLSFIVDVDDFADGADLIQEPGAWLLDGDAQFADFNSNRSWTMPLLKRGAGTWQIGSVSANYSGKVAVEAGEIAFSASESLPLSEGLELKGGKLTAMTGTTQTLKWLTFTAPSALGLGEGASLVFTSVPSGDWAHRLTVTGDVGATSLKMPALTAQQLRQIRINGHRAVQDDDGYLQPTDPGLMLILR